MSEAIEINEMIERIEMIKMIEEIKIIKMIQMIRRIKSRQVIQIQAFQNVYFFLLKIPNYGPPLICIWQKIATLIQGLFLVDQAFLIYIYHAEKVCFECLNVPFIWLFGDKVVVTKVEWETLDLATPPTPPGLMTS